MISEMPHSSLLFIFFFSSRRRHTRLQGDWSSDVCSSDLGMTAQFGQPEINLGIIPGAGGTQRLTRTVGKYRANELILTGRRVKADGAKAIGRTIAEKPPVATRLATEAVDLAWNSTLDAGLEFERKAFSLLFAP